MNIDSLVISLGLDPKPLQAALAQVESTLQQFGLQVQGFANGFEQGMNGATEGAGQASNAATEATAKYQRLGNAAQEAGRQGRRGMRHLAAQTQRVGGAASGAASRMNAFGQRAGSVVAGLAMRFAAPLTALASAGGIVNKYMGDVAQVAQMTGRYFPQMEEWRKKREMLSRINREDIELYRKGKLALLDFNFAMAGLATTIMRAISPAIRVAIEWLGKVSDWIRRNEPNIVRFITIVAGIITAVMVPALWKMAAAMLANPLTWIIAGLLLLVAVIDDLVVYIRGGESALDDFWAIFGTGAEIAQKLGAAWEWLKAAGKQLWADVGAAARAAWAVFEEPVEHVKAAFQAFVNYVRALLSGSWKEAGQELRSVFENVLQAIGKLFVNIAEGFFNAIVSVGERIFDYLSSLLTWDNITKGWGAAKGFFSGLFGTENRTAEQVGRPQALPATSLPTSLELTATGAAAQGKAGNTYNTDSKVNVGQVTVQTQATDADGIARDIRGGLDRTLGGLGTAAADGGVR